MLVELTTEPVPWVNVKKPDKLIVGFSEATCVPRSEGVLLELIRLLPTLSTAPSKEKVTEAALAGVTTILAQSSMIAVPASFSEPKRVRCIVPSFFYKYSLADDKAEMKPASFMIRDTPYPVGIEMDYSSKGGGSSREVTVKVEAEA